LDIIVGRPNDPISTKAEYLKYLEALYQASKAMENMIIEKPWIDEEFSSLKEFKNAIKDVEKAHKLIH
jgi:pyruvate formate-lyase activating enzyme-like uncharacterized protein